VRGAEEFHAKEFGISLREPQSRRKDASFVPSAGVERIETIVPQLVDVDDRILTSRKSHPAVYLMMLFGLQQLFVEPVQRGTLKVELERQIVGLDRCDQLILRHAHLHRSLSPVDKLGDVVAIRLHV
jgi:hypothetical protein